MKIVLDTNIIVSDFHMNGGSFRLLLDGIERAGHSLFVLQIVLDEVINKYREMLSEARSDLIRAQNRFYRLAKHDLQIPLDKATIEQIVSVYKKELHDYLLLNRHTYARQVFYPALTPTHQELVCRALRRQKPFSEKGTGYRDALIWYNVLWIAETYGLTDKIAFISTNIKDFADRDNNLHPDLQKDFIERELDPSGIVFYPSLKAFVEEQIKGQFEKFEDLKITFNRNTYDGFDFREGLLEGLEVELLSQDTNDARLLDSPPEYENLVIRKVLKIEQYDVTDARGLNSITRSISYWI